MSGTFLTDYDLHLFAEGTHARIWEKLGAHPVDAGGRPGVHFAVWAPNARRVSVVGDWNGWQPGMHAMNLRGGSGVWELVVPGVAPGARYKYAIESRVDDYRVEKADPFGFAAEIRPQTASRVWSLDGYAWGDADWMAARATSDPLSAPLAVYEVHLGSWMRVPEEGDRWLSYREVAPKLAAYARDLGYTHVELLPITEHPLDASWGYQTVGYYAPTSRFGDPQDLMFLVDTLHQAGVGVILDWVPAHFPRDEHGLGYFDGTHLYEHADPRQGVQPEWGTFVFNYGRREVQTFLVANALFWLERYHVDGLRIDAVAAMLYLDYSRRPGEWIPNAHGGRENLDAVALLRRVNEQVYAHHPGAFTVAEESTSWPMVSRPTWLGGLGFGFKWDMGWMHDTLDYLHEDPVHRHFHHDRLTFRGLYAAGENYVLPLSHDEVVHGKGSLLGRMPGDDWQRFANLRLLHGSMYAQPGKKLLFMGGEIGQAREWRYDASLDWHLLADPRHAGVQRFVRDLNALYRAEPALHELDCDPAGFDWVDCRDAEQSVLAFLRWGRRRDEAVLVVCNYTPVVRQGYRIGVPWDGFWMEILNGDAVEYGGSGVGNLGGAWADPVAVHARPASVALTLPPLAVIVLRGVCTRDG